MFDFDWGECQECKTLRSELEDAKKEHVQEYESLREKIISTDVIIKKYKVAADKCEELEKQNKELRENSKKADRWERECQLLSAQLKVALKTEDPTGRTKERLEKKVKSLEKQLQDGDDKQKAHHATVIQFQNMLTSVDKEKQSAEVKVTELQKKIKDLETSLKKSEASAKRYEDAESKRDKRRQTSEVQKTCQRLRKKLKMQESRMTAVRDILKSNGLSVYIRKLHLDQVVDTEGEEQAEQESRLESLPASRQEQSLDTDGDSADDDFIDIRNVSDSLTQSFTSASTARAAHQRRLQHSTTVPLLTSVQQQPISRRQSYSCLTDSSLNSSSVANGANLVPGRGKDAARRQALVVPSVDMKNLGKSGRRLSKETKVESMLDVKTDLDSPGTTRRLTRSLSNSQRDEEELKNIVDFFELPEFLSPIKDSAIIHPKKRAEKPSEETRQSSVVDDLDMSDSDSCSDSDLSDVASQLDCEILSQAGGNVLKQSGREETDPRAAQEAKPDVNETGEWSSDNSMHGRRGQNENGEKPQVQLFPDVIKKTKADVVIAVLNKHKEPVTPPDTLQEVKFEPIVSGVTKEDSENKPIRFEAFVHHDVNTESITSGFTREENDQTPVLCDKTVKDIKNETEVIERVTKLPKNDPMDSTISNGDSCDGDYAQCKRESTSVCDSEKSSEFVQENINDKVKAELESTNEAAIIGSINADHDPSDVQNSKTTSGLKVISQNLEKESDHVKEGIRSADNISQQPLSDRTQLNSKDIEISTNSSCETERKDQDKENPPVDASKSEVAKPVQEGLSKISRVHAVHKTCEQQGVLTSSSALDENSVTGSTGSSATTHRADVETLCSVKDVGIPCIPRTISDVDVACVQNTAADVPCVPITIVDVPCVASPGESVTSSHSSSSSSELVTVKLQKHRKAQEIEVFKVGPNIAAPTKFMKYSPATNHNTVGKATPGGRGRPRPIMDEAPVRVTSLKGRLQRKTNDVKSEPALNPQEDPQVTSSNPVFDPSTPVYDPLGPGKVRRAKAAASRTNTRTPISAAQLPAQPAAQLPAQPAVLAMTKGRRKKKPTAVLSPSQSDTSSPGSADKADNQSHQQAQSVCTEDQGEGQRLVQTGINAVSQAACDQSAQELRRAKKRAADHLAQVAAQKLSRVSPPLASVNIPAAKAVSPEKLKSLDRELYFVAKLATVDPHDMAERVHRLCVDHSSVANQIIQLMGKENSDMMESLDPNLPILRSPTEWKPVFFTCEERMVGFIQALSKQDNMGDFMDVLTRRVLEAVHRGQHTHLLGKAALVRVLAGCLSGSSSLDGPSVLRVLVHDLLRTRPQGWTTLLLAVMVVSPRSMHVSALPGSVALVYRHCLLLLFNHSSLTARARLMLRHVLHLAGWDCDASLQQNGAAVAQQLMAALQLQACMGKQEQVYENICCIDLLACTEGCDWTEVQLLTLTLWPQFKTVSMNLQPMMEGYMLALLRLLERLLENPSLSLKTSLPKEMIETFSDMCVGQLSHKASIKVQVPSVRCLPLLASYNYHQVAAVCQVWWMNNQHKLQMSESNQSQPVMHELSNPSQPAMHELAAVQRFIQLCNTSRKSCQ